ncbi:uncharacterized protein BJ212DRAFT_1474907 [Suillus subaureus]|uniref:Nephrocystin 3-like N-terminal domain-containing protein n=1 Tax=Suillus subaureus TaxID=48587 RepID=A0A9P7EMP6_9AGAM|nr:uncharacterized protein BJ212DRAFT_1474907 [Suillus subaureus]KAG1825514.1 hypothetical protein BJ212DRAFT_1474907 [Suillus subaureus]
MGYFFMTLAYQLASNFPSIQEDMEELFLQPLWILHHRLSQCPPSVFVVDALDECISPTELADLISLLGQALREPNLPVIHILLTSCLEEHIHKAMQNEGMHSLVCKIPANTSGASIAVTISLDDADVDNVIYIYLEHSFRKLQSHHPDFPQLPRCQLARLAK